MPGFFFRLVILQDVVERKCNELCSWRVMCLCNHAFSFSEVLTVSRTQVAGLLSKLRYLKYEDVT